MKRGFNLYVEAIVLLKAKPRTTRLLQRALGRAIGMNALRRVLRCLMDADVLRSAGWKGQERIYGVADGRPNVLHPVRVDKPVAPMAHVTKFAAIWQELLEPTSALDLYEQCGTPVNLCRKLMQRMAAVGLVGVSYRPRVATLETLYQRGAANEPRPPRQSPEARQRRQREGRAARALFQAFTFSAAPPPARLGRAA